jgi:hypothetical protein
MLRWHLRRHLLNTVYFLLKRIAKERRESKCVHPLNAGLVGRQRGLAVASTLKKLFMAFQSLKGAKATTTK